MLTFEMLYAVLQGLPPKFLDFLDLPWQLLCARIQRALRAGVPPLHSLKYALREANASEKMAMKRALTEVLPVLQIAGLSFRQKEALIALRYAGTASLAQLSRVLVQDRGNTHRRLSSLVKKGYAVKFFRPDGIYYFAVHTPIDQSLKAEVHEIFNALLTESASLPVDGRELFRAAPLERETFSAEPSNLPNALRSNATTPTTPTTSTKVITPTHPQRA